MTNNLSHPNNAMINLCPRFGHSRVSGMQNLLKMCLFDMQARQAVPPCEFHKQLPQFFRLFLPRPHYQRQLHSFRLLSKGQSLLGRFALHYFRHSTTHPPPVLSLIQEFESKTAPPAMEQPTKRKENRQTKILFIFPLIQTPLLQSYYNKKCQLYKMISAFY